MGLLKQQQENTEAWPTTHRPLLHPDEASMRFPSIAPVIDRK
jgi:hypothetical protein